MAHPVAVNRFFDAAHFCNVVRSGVGDGPISSQSAFQNTSAFNAASKALQNFASDAKSQPSPDVIAAYLRYSPNADEIFNSLRAIAHHSTTASHALNCLIQIVNYSLKPPSPSSPVDAAKAVVNRIVKSRASLVLNVFDKDKTSAAKVALQLLRLVALCHPMLAREVLNTFLLTSKNLPAALCTTRNSYCRTPFLHLLAVIFNSANHHVRLLFSTTARPLLITSLNTITTRTVQEANRQPKPPVSQKPQQSPALPPISSTSLPSYVQTRELEAATNFISALHANLFDQTYTHQRRKTFAAPMCNMLATIACTDMPSLSVAPRQVTEHHKTLRQTAAKLFTAFAKEAHGWALNHAAAALLSTPLVNGTSVATSFTLNLLREQPRLSSLLLTSGPFLTTPPDLSMKWMSYSALISICLLSIKYPITAFNENENGFLVRCLRHESPMVRHYGQMFTLALCRVVRAHPPAMSQPGKYLPSVDTMKLIFRNDKAAHSLLQSIFVEYQAIFDHSMDKRNTLLLKTAINTNGGAVLEAENAIRASLRRAPRETVTMAVHGKYLSVLVTEASRSNDLSRSSRLWRLCADILRHSFLFPLGTKSEIDIYLAVISSLGRKTEACVSGLQSMISMAIENPYALYDHLEPEHASSGNPHSFISLLSVAAIFRIRKPKSGIPQPTESKATLRTALINILTSIIACRIVLGTQTTHNDFLTKAIPDLATPDLDWLHSCSSEETPKTNSIIAACFHVQNFLSEVGTYPHTPYLRLVGSVSAYRLRLLSGKQSVPETRFPFQGLDRAWDSWRDLEVKETAHMENDNKSEHDNVVSEMGFGLLPPFFFHKYNLDVHLNKNLEGELSSLKKSLPGNEYSVLVCTLLCTSKSYDSQSLLLREALSEIELIHVGSMHGMNEVLFFIYETVISSLRSHVRWDRSLIDAVIDMCIRSIPAHHDDIKSMRSIAFAAAALRNLVQHSYPSVSVYSSLILQKMKLSNASFLPFLPLHTVKQLLEVVPHFPDLKRLAALEIVSPSKSVGERVTVPTLVAAEGLLKESLTRKSEYDSKREWSKSLLNIGEYFASVSEEETKQLVPNYNIIRRALGYIGECLIVDLGCGSQLAALMERLWGSSKLLSNFAWILWECVFWPDCSTKLDLNVSNQALSALFKVLSDCIARADECTISSSISALHVFCGLVSVLRRRKVSLHGSGSDPKDLEAQMSLISSKLLGFAKRYLCGLNMKDKEKERGILEGHEHFSLVCTCITNILKMDIFVDKIADEALLLLCAEENTLEDLVRAQQGDISDPLDKQATNNTNVICSVVSLLYSALCRLNVATLSKSLDKCMELIENALTCPSVHKASNSPIDNDIRELMDKINEIRRRESILKSVLQSRRGYFHSSAAEVLPLFDKHMMEVACSDVLRTAKKQTDAHHFTKAESEIRVHLDPYFVLRTFLYGCGQALEQPMVPMLDIVQLTHGGTLDLALSGLASPDNDLRALAYACIELFTRFLGPMRKGRTRTAADLCKDRKQLSFLMTLLRNSISKPSEQCLPLFIAWFRLSLKVALKPRHPSNKIVTTFFLRAPQIDVSNCVGLYHLLHCAVTANEAGATRSLAFNILQKGVHSKKDALVVRKRKLINSCLMMATWRNVASFSGHIDALNTIKAIIERDSDLELVHEMLARYNLVPCLVQNMISSEYDEHRVVTNIDVIACLAKELLRYPNPGKYASILSKASRQLGDFARDNGKKLSNSAETSLVRAGLAVCRMMPDERRTLQFNFSTLLSVESLRQRDAKSHEHHISDVTTCITRQTDVRVSSRVWETLLQEALRLDHLQAEAYGQKERDILFVHAFIAESFLRIRSQQKQSTRIESHVLELLAKVLYSQRTVWSILASYTALDLCENLPNVLLSYSCLLPNSVPHTLRKTVGNEYTALLEDETLNKTLVSSLLLVSARMNVTGEVACEPKSASSQE